MLSSPKMRFFHFFFTNLTYRAISLVRTVTQTLGFRRNSGASASDKSLTVLT